jgi:transcriptional regulator with XRE-family HTH domain
VADVNFSEQAVIYSELARYAMMASSVRPSPTTWRFMSLAARLRKLRESQGFTLDDLATRAKISKTYLWELERDAAGERRPSADVLLRVATALSVTIADLMALPTVQVQEGKIELSRSLRAFRDRMQKLGTPLSQVDLRDLALMKFRGSQPQTADEWHQLYLTLVKTTGPGENE